MRRECYLSQMPECKECKQDCFAYRKGKCSVLINTDFATGRSCPFYKSKSKYAEDLKTFYSW